MSDITSALKEAERNELRPIYALVGTETALIERAVSALRKAAVGEGGIPGFNEDVLHGRETDGASVAGAASTLPMMAERRFVLVRHMDQMKADLDALSEYVKAPNPSTCLVMTATKLNGSTKLAKALKKGGFRFDANPLKGGALVDYVVDEAKRSGHSIGKDAAYALTESIGSDLAALSDAVTRLGFYVGAGQRIDVKAVEACITRVRVDSIWQLVDAVGLRKTDQALAAASSLLADREPPLRILAMIARQLRMVGKMRDGLASGMSDGEAAKSAGAPPFKARELKEAARRFNLVDLTHAFEVLAETDHLLKGSKQPGAVVLEHAVLQLCSRH